MKKSIIIIAIVILLVMIVAGVVFVYYLNINKTACIGEGGSVGPNPNAPKCCKGLDIIMNKDEAELRANPPNTPWNHMNVGGIYICTAKCGNGVCDIATENMYNCSQDCP